jgi:hypothetical protein
MEVTRLGTQQFAEVQLACRARDRCETSRVSTVRMKTLPRQVADAAQSLSSRDAFEGGPPGLQKVFGNPAK